MYRPSIVLMLFMTLASCHPPAPQTTETARNVIVQRADTLSNDREAIYTGSIRAANRAELGFESSGIITSLTADLGARFLKGDVLGTVDDTTARLDLEARQADLADAQSVYIEARLDFERRASLRGTGAISNAAIDQAKARFDSAAARLAAIEAQLGAARKRLSDTRLIAPFEGEVAERLAEPSQVVSVGQPVLSVIGREDGLEGVVNLPERTRSRLKVGERATIKVRATDEALFAIVSEIGARSNEVGLFPVTFAIERGDETGLAAGQTIEVRLVSHQTAARTLTIPLASYTVGADGKPDVFVVNATGDAVRRVDVELGRSNNSGIEVISGLEPSDLVIVRGADLLNDGEAVIPVGAQIARYND